MAARVDALEEQNRELKSELGLRIRDGVIGSLMNRLGLYPKEALALIAIHEGRGRMVRTENIMEFARIETEVSMRTHVSRLRSILGKDAIQTFSNEGYGITPQGAAKVLAAIEPVAIQPPREAA
jgi:DNA-binding response OmpR family regulator